MDSISGSRCSAISGVPSSTSSATSTNSPGPGRATGVAFGTSIHAAVEWLHRERMAGRMPHPEGAVSIFMADWYAQNVEPLVYTKDESKDSLTERGIRWCTRGQPRWCRRPLRSDSPWVSWMLRAGRSSALHGVIDLIESDGTVVDLKTSARLFDAGSIERHLQMSIYALATLMRRGSIPRLRIDALLKTKIPRLERYDVDRNSADLARAARLIDGVVQAIDREMFFPNP